MSDPTQDEGGSGSGDWAPHDYTDGRKKGKWKTIYPEEARKGIILESIYLVALFIGYLAAMFYVIFTWCNTEGVSHTSLAMPEGPPPTPILFYGFLGAWIGGSLGGCSFGLKWMYHSVAKELWHEDRRLWRLLTPHLSGVVALVMVLLVYSNLVQLFDKSFVERPIGVMAFSWIVGYFSDKALAKMAEVADTLFGGSAKDK